LFARMWVASSPRGNTVIFDCLRSDPGPSIALGTDGLHNSPLERAGFELVVPLQAGLGSHSSGVGGLADGGGGVCRIAGPG
jgi:hypothetical protein